MTDKCQYCGLIHETKCSLISAIEYHPDGTVKRVEFHAPQPLPIPGLPMDAGDHWDTRPPWLRGPMAVSQ